MKIIQFILINFTLVSLLAGQESNKIKVYYEAIITPNERNILKNTQGSSEAKNAIMHEMRQIKEYQLVANDVESVFEEIQQLDNNQMNTNVRFGNNKGLQLYINQKDSLSYEQVNLHKLFLVKTSLAPLKWKLDHKYFNGNLKRAHALDTIRKRNITAYYSTDLNYKIGPDKFWGLPGAIVELKIDYLDENSMIDNFTFKSIKIVHDPDRIITLPKGKVITQDEYDTFITKIKEGHRLSEGINQD